MLGGHVTKIKMIGPHPTSMTMAKIRVTAFVTAHCMLHLRSQFFLTRYIYIYIYILYIYIYTVYTLYIYIYIYCIYYIRALYNILYNIYIYIYIIIYNISDISHRHSRGAPLLYHVGSEEAN